MALRVHDGDLRISEPGRVVDGLDIRGRVFVDAPNVTIRNSIVRGPDEGLRNSSGLIVATSGQPGLQILSTEITPTVPSGWANGIMGYNFMASRLDIHGVIDGIHITGGNVTISDSWLHDNLHLENDPGQGGRPSHDDSIQIQAGSNIRMSRNNISGALNSGLQVTQDRGPVSDLVFEDNFADGGGCVVNVAEKSRGRIENIRVTGNEFGLNTKVNRCAVIAPSSSPIDMWDNQFTDGQPAGVTKG